MSTQHSRCNGSTSPDVYTVYGMEALRKDVATLTVGNRHYIDATPPSTNAHTREKRPPARRKEQRVASQQHFWSNSVTIMLPSGTVM